MNDASHATQSAAGKPRIVFFGNERLATGVHTTAPTLQALIDNGYDVAAVVSHYEQSRSRNGRDLEIAAVAEKHNIPVLLPERPADILDQLQAFHAEAGVLVAYGKIVPQPVIDSFPRGIINIHPSLLPLHRGPTPIESVILDGSNQTGVSIMQLVKAMDAGPVYAQSVHRLHGNETKQELAEALLQLGGKLLMEALPGILDGTLQPKPQDDTKATFDSLLTKDGGKLDFSKPAVRLEREIRAYAEWPKSRAAIGGIEVIVTAARAVKALEDKTPGTIWHDDHELHVHTKDGVLVIDRLKPAGKAEMSARDFLLGYGRQFQP